MIVLQAWKVLWLLEITGEAEGGSYCWFKASLKRGRPSLAVLMFVYLPSMREAGATYTSTL